MIVRINNVRLEGTAREIFFEPGLNIITGPIASGKTTLIRLVKSLLGGSLANLPPEAKQSVTAVSGDITLGEKRYTVFRPAVTTPDATIEIAGERLGLRIPLSQPTGTSKETYGRWLLERLNLPRLSVPSAPTKPESEPTPVTIRDYLHYCSIDQDEIGFSVFGHTDPFKNIKRKYVFEIVYGLYSVETARLQEQLREVQSNLRQLKSRTELFSHFLEDTPFENRAQLEKELADAQRELEDVEKGTVKLKNADPGHSITDELRHKEVSIRRDLDSLVRQIDSENQAMSNLDTLRAQLESYSERLTRSIVAHKYLSDIDFVVCPRCGSRVDGGRGKSDKCDLCLQSPGPPVSRKVLVAEQARIDAQLEETKQLLTSRQQRIASLRVQLEGKNSELSHVRKELDFRTSSYISAQAEKIASLASQRAELQSRITKARDYLAVLQKLEKEREWVAKLANRKTVLEEELAAAEAAGQQVKERIDNLVNQYNSILQIFRTPEFGEEARSTIDRRTYLPIYRGRRFDDLSSPGLASLVTLAYALAHHRTTMALDLPLPNLLIVDGVSEHLGEEGLDPERLNAVYNYLIKTSDEVGDKFQVIVIDNEVPSHARSFVRLELSEDDRLIPVK